MSKARNKRGARTPAREAPAPRPTLNPAFADLKRLHGTLKTQRQEAAAQHLRRSQERAQAHDDAELFRRMVGKVIPLKASGRIEQTAQASPRPLPYQRWADDEAVMRDAVSDEYGAEWLLETDDTLSYRRTGLGQDVVRKLRRGHWTVTAQLDLHGQRVDEARASVAEFLRACVRSERRCVRIIHGKGLGSANRQPILKEKVRRWLAQKDEVLAFVEARPDDGGSGVVLALLRGATQR